jgi:hypothetical protein
VNNQSLTDNPMAIKPTFILDDFSFELHGFDLVMQVSIFDNKITDNYDVLEIDFEGKQMFNLDYLKEHLEQNLQEELHAEIVKQTDSDEDLASEYRASIND